MLIPVKITFVLSVLLLSFPAFSVSKGPEKTEFHVKGVCNMCKERIENAALIKGVKMAEWNKETGMLKVVYRPDKVELKTIHQAVANAGHTTSKVPADPKAYRELPGCCKYDDGVHKH